MHNIQYTRLTSGPNQFHNKIGRDVFLSRAEAVMTAAKKVQSLLKSLDKRRTKLIKLKKSLDDQVLDLTVQTVML